MSAASPKPGSQAEFDALIILAESQHRAGQLIEAAAAYQKILALRPDIAEVYNSLGMVLKQLDKLDAAVAHYEQAVALKPSLYQAHNNLGNVLRQQGKFDQAAAQYRQAIALKPDVAETHNNLGKVLSQAGKLDDAMAQFEEAPELKPDYADAHYHRMDLKTFRAGDADLAALERWRLTADACLLTKSCTSTLTIRELLQKKTTHPPLQ